MLCDIKERVIKMESQKEKTVNNRLRKACCAGVSIIIILILLNFNVAKKYTLMDFENGFYTMAFEDSKDTFTTSSDDAGMSIDLSKTYIDEIEIKLQKSAGFNWRCQLFYALNDEAFNQENSIIYNAKADEQIINLKLKEKISRLRIDWGDESGKTFSVDSIVINPYVRFNGICLIILISVALYLISEIVVCLKDMIFRLLPANNGVVIRRIFCTCVIELLVIFFIISIFHGNNGIVEFWKFLRSPRTSNLSMTFTSLNFLFLFFPLCIAGYYLLRENYRDVFLVLVSLLFYSVGEPKMVWLLFVSIVVNYLFGLGLGKKEVGRLSRSILLAGMLLWNFGLLFYYKYFVFSLETVEFFTGKSIFIPEIIQPLGISFFTFRMVSFCLDVYWGTVPEQKNFIKVALYISFFPQLVMGPISKYNDFSRNFGVRKFDMERLGGVLNGL